MVLGSRTSILAAALVSMLAMGCDNGLSASDAGGSECAAASDCAGDAGGGVLECCSGLCVNLGVDGNCGACGVRCGGDTPRCKPEGSGCGQCNVDGDCAAVGSCGADGCWCSAHVCTPTAALGATCNGTSQCASGDCVDGVCCDTPAASCNGCRACNVAGSVGNCANVPAATDPHDACTADAATCTLGACAGDGTCRAPDGATCGTDQVCSSGSCTACTANSSCSTNPGAPCKTGATSCATGGSVCVDSGNAAAGTTCGSNQVCNGGGNCVACTVGASCSSNPGAPCKTGIVACATGVSCVDDANIAIGTVCGSNLACDGIGNCVTNPFPSTGVEGALHVTAGQTVALPAGVHNFTTITIDAGGTLILSQSSCGNGVLDLRATGDIVVAGTIDLSGAGGGSSTQTGGGGGGATAAVLGVGADGVFFGGAGMSALAGGCGPGPTGANGGGTLFGRGGTGGGAGGGCDQGQDYDTGAGAGGGGYAGGAGGWAGPGPLDYGNCNALAVGGNGGGTYGGIGGGSSGTNFCDPATGGSGCDAAYNGAPAVTATSTNAWPGNGSGGSIGCDAVADLAMMSTFRAGSAGGGGGCGGDDDGEAPSGGGAGGGGAGGALRLATVMSISITGFVLANGGGGGTGATAMDDNNDDSGGAGGGGSGGAIFIAAPTVTVSGTISTVGGTGGNDGLPTLGGHGGAGGLGRIRFSLSSAQSSISASLNPPAQNGAQPANAPGFAYVGSWPN